MLKLTSRQSKILSFVRRQGKATNQEVRSYLKKLARITIYRELKFLQENDYIELKGRGRSVYYQEKIKDELGRYIDVERYFKKGPDERKLLNERFDFSVFSKLRQVFTREELKMLKTLNEKYGKNIKKLSLTVLKKEFERLTIELSWKSSQIEGNTYSLVDTEVLIKEFAEAPGHKKEEAIMILNHKKVLDYVLAKPDTFKKLTLFKVVNLHDILVKDLGVEKGLRKRLVGIVGTRYRPLDNEHQIREAMQKMVRLINDLKDPFLKALIAILMLSYIQPFGDGNKRTARILGNAILLAHQVCPLSYRSVNEADYKKAILLFYEQRNVRFLKALFMEQFKFAVGNYFGGG